MAKNDIKTSYDEVEDILYVNKGIKSKFSIDLDNSILDIANDGKIIGLELLNASELFDLNGNVKKILSSISKTFFNVNYMKNSVVIKFGFTSKITPDKKFMIIQTPYKRKAVVNN